MIKGFLGNLEVGNNYPSRVVGVINLTKASFYERSIITTKRELEDKTISMISEGAECIDIGAQSTRPIQIYGGEGRVDGESELKIIKSSINVLNDVLSSYKGIEVSVDTQRKSVAEYSLNKGIRIINDISGFKKDEEIAKVIADFDATAVVMATRKEPGDVYLLEDIFTVLNESIDIGLRSGIKDEKLLIDPGIGSWEARDFKHDYNIIKNLSHFRDLNKPIYVGISRKTSIGKALNNAPPDKRLYGTLGATIVALIHGANVIRTHDIKPTLEAIRVAEAILNYQS